MVVRIVADVAPAGVHGGAAVDDISGVREEGRPVAQLHTLGQVGGADLDDALPRVLHGRLLSISAYCIPMASHNTTGETRPPPRRHPRA